MQIRHVVTCFLRHPEQRTVLLGLRSDDVRTYPGHYAGISGSIEDESPLERAVIEIGEETGLDEEQISLRGEGWPIRFPAWELDTVWVVHPFLFDCLDPASVRRDWEHVKFDWVPPENIPHLDTVPKLHEAWESSLDAAAAGGTLSSDRIFSMVKEDREHGASELGIWTLRGLMAASDEVLCSESADPTSALREACRRAAGLRPSMATTLTAVLEAWSGLRGIETADDAARREASEHLKRLAERRGDASVRAGTSAADQIAAGQRVVTISSSFTVLLALKEAADKIKHITMAESRPAFEGRRAAEAAASFGIDTELVTDAAACSALTSEADLVLFGADSLLADGSVVNKVGTLALCASALLLDRSTLAVATLDKLLPAGLEPEMEEMDPEGLGADIDQVRVRNPYFECVPARAVDHICCESGIVDAAALRNEAKKRRELARELLR